MHPNLPFFLFVYGFSNFEMQNVRLSHLLCPLVSLEVGIFTIQRILLLFKANAVWFTFDHICLRWTLHFSGIRIACGLCQRNGMNECHYQWQPFLFFFLFFFSSAWAELWVFYVDLILSRSLLHNSSHFAIFVGKLKIQKQINAIYLMHHRPYHRTSHCTLSHIKVMRTSHMLSNWKIPLRSLRWLCVCVSLPICINLHACNALFLLLLLVSVDMFTANSGKQLNKTT